MEQGLILVQKIGYIKAILHFALKREDLKKDVLEHLKNIVIKKAHDKFLKLLIMSFFIFIKRTYFFRN